MSSDANLHDANLHDANLQEDFQEYLQKELEQLNEKQREALDCLDGPLLVVAGPGTGKTQLLSLRAANICV